MEGAAVETAWELIDDRVIKVDSKGRVVCKGSEDSDIELVSSEDDSAGIELWGMVFKGVPEVSGAVEVSLAETGVDSDWSVLATGLVWAVEIKQIGYSEIKNSQNELGFSIR